MALKKVGKKDVTTKLKALGELREIFDAREPPVLREALPHWVYLYPKLCMHNDKRVRMAAHTAFAGLVRVP